MIGAIIGDIAGSRFEFSNTKTDKFKLLARECDFTDDTICTVAVADAIMHGRKFDEALRDWGWRYPHPKGGYGWSFGRWLKDRNAGPYWSWGNGAAMRVSAIPYLCESWDDVVSRANESAMVSHNHPEGIKGAVVTAGGSWIILDNMFALGDRTPGLVSNAKKAFADWVGSHYDVPEYRPFSNPFKETCMNAVPVAASCLLASTSFEDAIRKAVLVGGDSDTIAAITGGWAEALYGVPEGLSMIAKKYLPKDILGIVDEFYRIVYR